MKGHDSNDGYDGIIDLPLFLDPHCLVIWLSMSFSPIPYHLEPRDFSSLEDVILIVLPTTTMSKDFRRLLIPSD